MYRNFISNTIEYTPFRFRVHAMTFSRWPTRLYRKSHITLVLFELEALMRGLNVLEFNFQCIGIYIVENLRYS